MSILSDAVTALENGSGQVTMAGGEQAQIKMESAPASQGATVMSADGKQIQVPNEIIYTISFSQI